MSAPTMELVDLLCHARSGGIHGFGDQGPECSAQWQVGDAVPACLLLNDLEVGTLPEGFGSDPIFASVLELDLSGNMLRALPHDMFHGLGALRVLFLGGPGPKFTPEGRTCNVLEALPPMDALVHLEHLSLHDNSLTQLPELTACCSLHTLRLDRNPLRALPDLPLSLHVLHLEGCPLGGTLERPDDLPAQVRALPCLDDLLLPDGSHVGEFFGTPLGGLLTAQATRLPSAVVPTQQTADDTPNQATAPRPDSRVPRNGTAHSPTAERGSDLGAGPAPTL